VFSDGTLSEVPGFPVAEATEASEEGAKDDKGPKRGVPDFWLTALVHHDMLSAMLAEEDVPALNHLTDIRCIDQDDHQVRHTRQDDRTWGVGQTAVGSCTLVWKWCADPICLVWVLV
jgi:hypothetical protein